MKLDSKKIKIRNYKQSDYWFCYYLLKRNMFEYIEKYQGGWDSKIYRKNFHGKDVTIVEYGCKRIGFYNIEKRGKELVLIDIQVSNKYQGKGLGTYLFEVFESQAKKTGIKKIILGVYWDNPSINLYKRLGYRVIRRRKTHAVMSKNI